MMFGFAGCCCATAGAVATVTAANDAKMPSQMVLVMLRFLHIGCLRRGRQPAAYRLNWRAGNIVPRDFYVSRQAHGIVSLRKGAIGPRANLTVACSVQRVVDGCRLPLDRH